jgi:hypothetical protein
LAVREWVCVWACGAGVRAADANRRKTHIAATNLSTFQRGLAPTATRAAHRHTRTAGPDGRARRFTLSIAMKMQRGHPGRTRGTFCPPGFLRKETCVMGRPSNQEAHPLLHSLQEPTLLMLPPSLNYRPLDTGQHLWMLRNLRTTIAPLAFRKRLGKFSRATQARRGRSAGARPFQDLKNTNSG